MMHVRPVPPSMRKLLAVGCAVLGLGVTVGVAPAPSLAADGRAYELVSPPDKSGNSVDVRATVQSSPDGNAVAFSVPGALGDAPTSITGEYYLARRSGRAWSTSAVDAPQVNPTEQLARLTSYFSDDLSKAFQFSARALTPGAIEGGGNLYLSDTLTGTRQLAAATTDLELMYNFAQAGIHKLTGASSDLSHVAFQTSANLLPSALPGAANIYEYANGQLRLVNVLEDGTTVPDPRFGSTALTFSPRMVSADGSRIFFAAGDGPLYVRENGTTTSPLSVSRRAGDPSTPVPAVFGGASRDGNVVYFLAKDPLTDDASDRGAYGSDVYRYDFRTDTLTDVSASTPAQPADIFQINAVSEDGEHVYFTGYGQLAPGAVQYGSNFYVSHNGDIRLVAVLADGESSGPYELSTSPNGRYIAFVSVKRLTAADTTDPACGYSSRYGNNEGECAEVYVFDAATGRLDCPSCKTVDGRNRFADLGRAGSPLSSYMPTLISNEGRLFFNSEARLVKEDTNGARDVYEWDGQRSTLVSPGRGSGDSTLAEVSSDGSNVYFFSPQRLVAQDTDDVIDLYDARVGGGLSSQNEDAADAIPCDGDGCQGVLLPARGRLPEIPTVMFDGRGNPPTADPKVPSTGSKATVRGPTLIRGSSFAVSVQVPQAGRILVTGGRIRAASQAAGHAGRYRLRVALTAHAKSVLRRSKRLAVPVRVVYVTKRGVRSSTTLNVTFKA